MIRYVVCLFQIDAVKSESRCHVPNPPRQPTDRQIMFSSLITARGTVAESPAALDNLGLGDGDNVDGNRVEL